MFDLNDPLEDLNQRGNLSRTVKRLKPACGTLKPAGASAGWSDILF
jgi:hypothetical protein